MLDFFFALDASIVWFDPIPSDVGKEKLFYFAKKKKNICRFQKFLVGEFGGFFAKLAPKFYSEAFGLQTQNLW